MEKLLAAFFPPKLPVLDLKEVIRYEHVHDPFEIVTEDGIGIVREKAFRDAIERIHTQEALEDVT